jgi:NAD(P)-dependent dehydrogenase (short-subunit alcohol dehydrogenase family)
MFAIVTGASRGIGRSTVQHLLSSNVAVLAVSRTAKKEAALQQMASHWDNLELLNADLSTDEGMKSVVAHVHDRQISHLFHNAGGVDTTDFNSLTPDEFRKMMMLNVEVPLLMTRSLKTQLAPNSRILLMSSRLSKKYMRGMTGYCISRSAGLMLKQVLETEMFPRLVASLNPGNVVTDTLRASVQRLDNEKSFRFDMCWTPDQIGRFIKYILIGTSDSEFCSLWEANDPTYFPYWIRTDEVTPIHHPGF